MLNSKLKPRTTHFKLNCNRLKRTKTRTKSSQTDFFEKSTSKYGGSLLTTRKGRASGRPISTQHSMHFVLKSSQAIGEWSFFKHRQKIRSIIEEFAVRYGVKLNSMANVGNHLHLHLQITNRYTYKRFICAISAAIMMSVTGISRWSKTKLSKKFWDYRPFSRVIVGFKALLSLNDYIRINEYEGWGYSRAQSHFLLAWDRDGVMSG